MSNSPKKANGEPRQKREHLTARQRSFAEHYAVNGDWTEAYRHAYPTSRNWSSESLHGAIHRLRKNMQIMRYIHELRAPIIEQLQVDYAWVLNETVRQYYECAAEKDRANALRALRQVSRLIGADVGGRPLDVLPDPAVIEGESSRVDELSDDELLRIAGAAGGSTGGAAEAGAAGAGTPLPRQFLDVLLRRDAGEAPSDPVHVSADGDRGLHAPGDGVHAARGREIDLRERLRTIVGGRAPPRHCAHCGLAHEGPCQDVRAAGAEHDPGSEIP